jgi:hypothetical protein
MNDQLNVVVSIYPDGEYVIDAPDGVNVTVRHVLGGNDDTCGCGFPIYRDDDGDWHHYDAPERWGDDHTAEPS